MQILTAPMQTLRTLLIAGLALLLHACASNPTAPQATPETLATELRARTIAELRRNAHLSVSELSSGELLVRIRSTDHFRSSAHNFSDEFGAIVDHIAQVLAPHPALHVTVIGHTDNVGNANHNLQLSTSRAHVVHAHLVARGVDDHRIRHEGRGGAEPIASNQTNEGRAVNRRVDFLIRIDPTTAQDTPQERP